MRHALVVEELSQHAAVALLLGDEKLQRRQEPGVRGEYRMRRGPPHEAAAARPFAELELLNGAANHLQLGRAEPVGVMPGKGSRALAVLKKPAMPALKGRSRRRKNCGGHSYL